MKNVFMSFVGNCDLEALKLKDSKFNRDSSAMLYILENLMRLEKISEFVILNDWGKSKVEDSVLKNKIEEIYPKIIINIINVRSLIKNYNPSNHRKIYSVLELVSKEYSLHNSICHINLSSGTSTISSMLLIHAKNNLKAKFYQSYFNFEKKMEIFEISDVPFNISFKEIETAVSTKHLSDNIIGKSNHIKNAVMKARKIAQYDVPCFIFGETGTGKELLAQQIVHFSQRKKNETINCSILSDELAASELFGHVEGAFTGANFKKEGKLKNIDGGILFLDEIGDLSLKVQTQLLRFIQEEEFTPVGSNKIEKSDVKIIAATHKDLYKMINNNTFREDLFYRIAVEIIEIPPLRERKEDIPMLAEYFVRKINKEFSKIKDLDFTKKTLHPDAVDELKSYMWKGNIRELEHTLRRTIMWSTDNIITVNDIKKNVLILPSNMTENDSLESQITLNEKVANYEKKMIKNALEKSKWRQAEVAKKLGCTESTLSRKISKYKLEKEV